MATRDTDREQLRPHQGDCFFQAKEKNTIVCLDTGEGKTLIAVRLIEHFLRFHRGKRAVFLVPTLALVDQQADYLRRECLIPTIDGDDDSSVLATPEILLIEGEKQAGWEKLEWQKAIRENDILLGTPAVFLRAATHNFISIDQFCVLVFDECQHAKKNSAMASIMRDAVHPYWKKSKSKLPRILGLTASFAYGGDGDLKGERRNLEALMNSTIICPDVAPRFDEDCFRKIEFGSDEHHSQQHIDEIDTLLEAALRKLGRVTGIKKAVKQCIHVFKELGRESLLFYVQHAIMSQIVDKIANLDSLDDENTQRAAQTLRSRLPDLRCEMQQLDDRLRETFTTDYVPRTPKLQCLLELLQRNFSCHDNDSSYRGMVFVQEISLVSTVAHQINEFFSGSNWLCGVLAGTKAQTKENRKENLECFRKGVARILVSSSAGEEGLDVPECQFVILYSKLPTTKSQIQRIGRVRSANAELYYMENDPNTERRKAAQMAAVARDTSLNLSPEKLKSQSEGMTVVTHVHPYPPGTETSANEGGGIINVFNCKEIFVQYCSRVLAQSINPSMELYDYTTIPGHQQEVLQNVRYPTPEAWKTVRREEMYDYWKGSDVKNVLLQERCKGKSPSEKDEMLFVYVVAVKLRMEGLLDDHNKPSNFAKNYTKSKCPLRSSFAPESIALNRRVTFKAATRNHVASTRGEISLEGSDALFRNYLRTVFDKEFLNTMFDLNEDIPTEDLFHYRLDGRAKPIPAGLFCPTPRGWEEISLEDYRETFENMDLADQLSVTKSRGRTEKMQKAFVYLAVKRLHEFGYLNENYVPILHATALTVTRKSCKLRVEDGTFVPTTIGVPVALSLSEASTPSGIPMSEVMSERVEEESVPALSETMISVSSDEDSRASEVFANPSSIDVDGLEDADMEEAFDQMVPAPTGNGQGGIFDDADDCSSL
ncbi:Dicer-like protein [Seminavis robusta]|uniref:Dicer-like protein n=1 Tax=Seminavis robusta TaxID=568900 RepID=A0A9N8HX70_9STRA|nr:Dicer-like protein [Seminavis robusta]|eukprot:Sro2140_g316210.1 Dicer-like protein (939) ;mRNA; f:11252-14068